MAACLAVVWVVAGLVGVLIGVKLNPGPLPIVIGLLALGYGCVWARVAVTGRRLRWGPGRRSSNHTPGRRQ